jgi:hypothetical protein
MSDVPHRPDLKGTLRRALEDRNPAIFARVQHDADAITRIAQIENRAHRIKQEVRTHYEANRESWVAKEAIKLWKSHALRTADLPAPPGVIKKIAPEALMRQARANVQARVLGRLQRVNRIKTQMGNAIVRNAQSLTPHHTIEPRLSGEFARKSPKRQQPRVSN